MQILSIVICCKEGGGEISLKLINQCRIFFDMSDNLFCRIFLKSFLIFFGSMIFSLSKCREEKENSVGNVFRNKQVKFLNI